MRPGIERRWFLPAFILLGVLCLLFVGSKLGLPANAQVRLQTAAEDGVLVIPVQIERDSYGLAMVDTIGQTVWIYEINSYGPAHSRLRLLAARSWRYDRLLRQYNTAEPKPQQVKMLLEDLAQQQGERGEQKQQDAGINILEIAEPNKQ